MITSAARGMSTMVALSSIYFREGSSPRTVRGARIIAASRGVPNQKWQPTQMEKETTEPAIIAELRFFLTRLNSPITGSTKVKPNIRGIP